MTFDDWCKQNNIPDNVTTICRMAFNARNREIKSLGERCNQLQKDKGNLTDRVRELEQQIEKMKDCKNCGWYYLQQHWRESKEINESRMFHCGTCGNKRNWKLKEIKEND